MTQRADLIVVGAGLVGLATARELAGRGLRVIVLEARQIGAGASSAGAGLLSPTSDWESARPFLEICRAARDLWQPWLAALVEESDVPVEYDRSGCLLVEMPGDDPELLDAETRFADEAGDRWAAADPAEVQRAIPDLTPDARRIVHLPGEHRVDNVAACAALAVACRRRGVDLREGAAARRVATAPDGNSVSVETATETFDAATLVLAAGAWSSRIEGVPTLPVRPVRGQMLRLGGAPWPFLGAVRGAVDYAVRRGAQGLLVGATVEEAGFAELPTADGIGSLLAFAARLFPGLSQAPIEAIWAGLRPGSPDGRPFLGPMCDGPVHAAFGHYRNGILLAPWTGIELANLIVDGRPIARAELFAPDRFSTSGARRESTASRQPPLEPPQRSR